MRGPRHAGRGLRRPAGPAAAASGDGRNAVGQDAPGRASGGKLRRGEDVDVGRQCSGIVERAAPDECHGPPCPRRVRPEGDMAVGAAQADPAVPEFEGVSAPVGCPATRRSWPSRSSRRSHAARRSCAGTGAVAGMDEERPVGQAETDVAAGAVAVDGEFPGQSVRSAGARSRGTGFRPSASRGGCRGDCRSVRAGRDRPSPCGRSTTRRG